MEKKNFCNPQQWIRIVYMIFFAIVLSLVLHLVALMVVVQVLFTLFTGKVNDEIKAFSEDVVNYFRQLLAFLLYIDNGRPFPFSDLQKQEDEPAQGDKNSKVVNKRQPARTRTKK